MLTKSLYKCDIFILSLSTTDGFFSVGPLSEVTTIKEEATGYSDPAISEQPGMAYNVYVLAIVAAVFVVVVILVAVCCFFMRKARDANGSNSVPSGTTLTHIRLVISLLRSHCLCVHATQRGRSVASPEGRSVA